MNSFLLASLPSVLSVSELNRLARRTLEQTLPLAWIAGEISNLTSAASGHWYFSLKDSGAQVRCVMFRSRNQFIDWRPENGMQVEVRATPTLYEARGEFQLQVDTLRRAGLGALFEAFEKTRARLELEGLFDIARKRAPPAFPRRIGIITSLQAAALCDVLSTFQRRMPGLPIIIYPTAVQGIDAAQQIVSALQSAYQKPVCDVLILCRGGGNIEDLWPFNEEIVARMIAVSPVPLICGVGHETDFTIADFAADLRAPTPTAAAELASPNRLDLLHRLEQTHTRLLRHAWRQLNSRSQQLDSMLRRLVHPGRRLQARQAALRHLAKRLHNAQTRALERREWRQATLIRRLLQAGPNVSAKQIALSTGAATLIRAIHVHLAHTHQQAARLASHLAHLNPQAVLARGYSIVQNQQGNIIQSSDQIKHEEVLDIQFAQGRARAKVLEKS